jgi:glycosyltransferase involved in cell wall biosynthesis
MKISFIIPFHNEEKNCLPMLVRVFEFGKREKLDFEIIPVDDRSNDKTPQILRAFSSKETRIRPIYRHKSNEEKGNTMGKALIAGTKDAKGEIVIWTMGDMADDTKTYKEIIRKLHGDYDMVFGSRYMPGGSRGNLDKLKALFSSWGTILARVLFNVPVHDITNAFRGFKRNVFKSINLESSGFSISPEFAIKAHLAGFKLGEVPTVYTNRVEGVSNFKLYKMTISYLTLYYRLFLKYRLPGKALDYLV